VVDAVLYPGTFDPITLGHRMIIERAAAMFPRVVVAVAGSSTKSTWFTLAERVELAQQSLADLTNVSIVDFHGLLVDCAKQHQINVVLRGLRTASDFDFEEQLAGLNKQLMPELETLFLPATPSSRLISSSLVKDIARNSGDVTPFVSPCVAKALQKGGA